VNNNIRIPIFITSKMKMRLMDMGYNKVMISHIKPRETWAILDGLLLKGKFVANVNNRTVQHGVNNGTKISKKSNRVLFLKIFSWQQLLC